MSDLETTAREAAALRQRVHAHMLATRGEKYASWLKNIGAARQFLLSGSPILQDPFFEDAVERLELIDTLYAFERVVDDFADDDAPLPPGWKSSVAYIEYLLRVTERPLAAEDDMGRLCAYILDRGDRLNMDLRPGMNCIQHSMLFDARRRESPTFIIPSRAELRGNYDRLDIEGTVGLWLMVLRENQDAFEPIRPLGEATRVAYDLRDLVEDMGKRRCNVPREDVEAFGMHMPGTLSKSDLLRWHDSGPTRVWRSHEAQRGLQLYAAYDAVRGQLPVHNFTRGILEYLFERETKAGLEGALKAA